MAYACSRSKISAMSSHRPIVAAVVAAVAASFIPAAAQAQASPRGAVPSDAALSAVREHVQTWLATNGFVRFRVDEVMAFSNNDYAAVSDKAGRPAFELLVATDRSWVMEEPASMMWNTRYGMLPHTSGTLEPIPGLSMMWGTSMMGSVMGSPHGWYSSGAGAVTSLEQAVTVANRWLARTRAGEIAESDGRSYPGYFSLDTTRNGKTFGMLSVNRVSGAVWYHGWHGAFLAEKQFAS
jgi:hypothetical protein